MNNGNGRPLFFVNKSVSRPSYRLVQSGSVISQAAGFHGIELACQG